jgi:hypothetical protein
VRVGGIGENERDGHQLLLLQAKVGMHPVGPGLHQEEIVPALFSGLNGRLGHIRDAILAVGQEDAVPMQRQRLLGLILEHDGVVEGGVEAACIEALLGTIGPDMVVCHVWLPTCRSRVQGRQRSLLAGRSNIGHV